MTSEQTFNCIFCKDVFESKEELQIHFRKHGDPKFNQKNRCRFPNDSEMSSEKPSDNVEMVGCDVCSEVFTTISKAITHKHKVHPDHDAKYFCPWCGKLFTMKHLYNKHMKINHSGTERPDDKNFHCDSCDVDFYIPSAVAYHNKFFHRQDTDMPDVGQSKKFKLHNQEVIPIFYCAFCGEEYDNKVNLFKHITDDHSDENQSPDEVLRCPLCEAIFYHLDAYEIHLTFHTPEDLYSIKNELYSDLSDFSLESLPPMVEKVENMETPDDAETAINSVGIDKFLELAMDQSEDDTSVKTKKHKKHKKSKKSAITLDEFLSMNTDVFGEGLDFQGIEEVPTKVVTKRLKNNKKSLHTKVVTPLELEKLKQQGIVIKRKVNENPAVRGIKVLKGVPASAKIINTAKKTALNKTKPDLELNTSDDVLSKLMSQSNHEIKIVKKSSQEKTIQETKKTPELTTADNENVALEDIKAVQKQTSEPESNEEDNVDGTKDTASRKENDTIKSSCHDSQDSLPQKECSPSRIVSCSKTATPDNELDIDSNTENPVVIRPPNNTNTSVQSPKSIKSQNTLISLQNRGNIVVKPSNFSNDDEDKVSENEQQETIQRDDMSDTDDEANDDEHYDKTEDEIDKNKCQGVSNSANNSLTALKHLSNLITVKPVSQNKTIPPVVDDMTAKDTTDDESDLNAIRDTKAPIPLPAPDDKEVHAVKQNINNKDPTLDALKTLSKNITIKSYPKPLKTNIGTDEYESEVESDVENDTIKETCNKDVADIVGSKNAVIKTIKNDKNEPEIVKPLNIPNKSYTERQISVSQIKKPNSENCVKNENANILKRLTNIITKPVASKKVEQVICKPTIIPNRIIPQQNEGEIEIFNIDDSDDEHEDNASNKESEVQSTIKPIAAVKNLSSNVTVKSANQQIIQKKIKVENEYQSDEEQQDDDHNTFTDDSDDNINTINTKKTLVTTTKLCSQKISNRNISLQNALKNLGKNITVKSRNSSPSLSIKSQDQNSQDSNVDAHEGSDSESNLGRVKITEIEDHVSKDDVNIENNTEHTSNAIVQSPNDSCSDDDHEVDDYENDIKVNTLKRPQSSTNINKNPVLLNTLKNLGKNITIKSLNDHNDNEGTSKSQEVPENPSNIKKQLSINTLKKSAKVNQNEAVVVNRNIKNVAQVEQSASRSVNQKQSSLTSNQVNTINKEVTVKTFQTQTVIQEITTTVTKTIKTVNQTMKQEIRNSSHNSNIPIKPQRVQGVRPNPSSSLQGVIVRHATPPVGAKIGNSVPKVRPSGTLIRSKQIVPARPGLNIARPSGPRMSVVRKPTPSPHKPVIGKPLKISPNAMSMKPSGKRPNTEELTGPFSCFKKPKESLIPGPDVANFSGESVAQFASTSHSSSSNFTSTTKVVKGNSVVTSTQMKSEVSANAQQISRLSNNSGLKIVKTSQAKQQMQTQEKSETNTMKQTTIAAIEKLQKQGLLVKKPRLDVTEDSEHSDLDDENVGYSSGEEHNE